MAQSNELNQFEARAYKRLYELYKSTLLTIIHQANTTISCSSDPEKIKVMLIVIGDEKKWDGYGIENKTDAKIIDELEKCLGV